MSFFNIYAIVGFTQATIKLFIIESSKKPKMQSHFIEKYEPKNIEIKKIILLQKENFKVISSLNFFKYLIKTIITTPAKRVAPAIIKPIFDITTPCSFSQICAKSAHTPVANP